MSSHFPSAPPMPDSYGSGQPSTTTTTGYGYSNYHPPPQTHYPTPPQSHHVGHASSFGYGPGPFPPGTHPDVIRSFQMVDRDRSGFIDDTELQQALSSGYQRFSLRTIRLLMFLFKNPNDSSLRLGPAEFAALWSSLRQWREMFEKFDKDRSGKIDAIELRDALYSLGYAVPPSVLQLLISHYDDRSKRKAELNLDSFVECATVIKGLTEKFKEKDKSYKGSATLSYDAFMSMVLPFLVTYN